MDLEYKPPSPAQPLMISPYHSRKRPLQRYFYSLLPSPPPPHSPCYDFMANDTVYLNKIRKVCDFGYACNCHPKTTRKNKHPERSFFFLSNREQKETKKKGGEKKRRKKKTETGRKVLYRYYIEKGARLD